MSWVSVSCGLGLSGVARGRLPGSSAMAPGQGLMAGDGGAFGQVAARGGGALSAGGGPLLLPRPRVVVVVALGQGADGAGEGTAHQVASSQAPDTARSPMSGRPLIRRGAHTPGSDQARGPERQGRHRGRARRRAAMRTASPTLQHPSTPAKRLIPPLTTDGDRPSTLVMRAWHNPSPAPLLETEGLRPHLHP